MSPKPSRTPRKKKSFSPPEGKKPFYQKFQPRRPKTEGGLSWPRPPKPPRRDDAPEASVQPRPPAKPPRPAVSPRPSETAFRRPFPAKTGEGKAGSPRQAFVPPRLPAKPPRPLPPVPPPPSRPVPAGVPPAGPAQKAPSPAAVPASVIGTPWEKFPRVVLKPQEDRRLRRGHLWIFSNEIASVPADVSPGETVHFYTAREELLGVGYYNPHSLIAGRLLDRHLITIDPAFLENRLRRAWDLRRRFFSDDAWRWVFGESDDLPGLVIDRYGDACVIESYAAGIDRLMPLILEAVRKIHPWKTIVLRNDVGPRRLEKLSESIEVVEGSADAPHQFTVDGMKVLADLKKGQKTGYFFDQRENRRAVAALSSGKRVLDVFCHTGGFGLYAAQAGAAAVTGVDNAEPALQLAAANAEANGFGGRMRFEKADAFDWLSRSKEKFDLVVLDPPRFAPGKKQLPAAIDAYIRLNALGLNRVAGDGILATASCSQHLGREEFRQVLSRAVQQSGRRARLVRWGGQAADHPVRLSMPETEYLKFALLHVS